MHRSGVPRLVLTLVITLSASLAAGCGAAPAGSATRAPDGGTTPTADTGSGAGETLTPADIEAALAALEARGAWTFEIKVTAASSGGDLSITGTERRQPDRAIAAHHLTGNGDFQYVRIGDDIWYDVATGEWSRTLADEADNLIRQYEPFHLSALVAMAGASRSSEYVLVGGESANGVAARHYRLSEEDRTQVTERLGLTPDDWSGDVWIAEDGGYLVRFVWGPQSVETMQQTGGIGFEYDATDVGCTCPVEPPA